VKEQRQINGGNNIKSNQRRVLMRPQYLLLGLIGLAMAGCQPTTVTEDTSSYGRFEGEVVAVWDTDGRNMTLREDFAFIDAENRRWIAPANSVVNGASIPSAFWTLIGGPFEGLYRNASVVHDVGCEEMTESWEDVHRMFYEACRAGGVEEGLAKTMYYAVYHFGPRWERVTETVVETHTDATGHVIEEEVQVAHLSRMDPPPPTPTEMAQVETFIADQKPDTKAIECFHRDSLHGLKCKHHPHVHAAGTPHKHAHPAPAGQVAAAPPVDRNNPFGRPGMHHRQRPHDGGNADRRFQHAELPAVSNEEEQWATTVVRQHLEQKSSEPRQANYRVERARRGFRVFVNMLAKDESGQMVPYEGGDMTVRIDREGRVLEAVNGMFTARSSGETILTR